MLFQRNSETVGNPVDVGVIRRHLTDVEDAQVVEQRHDFDADWAAAEEFSEETGARAVHPAREPDLIERTARDFLTDAVDQAIDAGKTLPLAGVPYAVKNLFDIEGVVTRAGSLINRDNPPAAADATLVTRMKMAGAVLLGGLNMGDEYLGKDPRYGAWRDTHVRLTGPIVLQLQLIFAEDWHWATGDIITGSASSAGISRNSATDDTTSAYQTAAATAAGAAGAAAAGIAAGIASGVLSGAGGGGGGGGGERDDRVPQANVVVEGDPRAVRRERRSTGLRAD